MKRITVPVVTLLIVSGMFVLAELQSCKHEPITPDLVDTTSTSGNPSPGPTTSTDGATLYANNCAGCHGVLASSTKLGATVLQIQNAISTVSAMTGLSKLTTAQVNAIAEVLKTSTTTPTPTPTPTTTDGATLYANYCASCHGALASSAKKGATVAQIQNGISTVSGMKSLSSLTAAQLQAISDVLKSSSPTPTPTPTPTTDGATLYANNCAGCHGPLATSAKRGATVTQIQNGISNVSGMKSLSSLTAAQIQAIADALKNSSPTPTPTPTDGATLYANYCAGCHGVLASSAKLGATASRIQSGISSVSAMSSLSSLTTAQVQAIADALASVPVPTDGPSLYSMYCASCHHALASSSVGSASVSEIQSAIRNKSKMKYLSILTQAQIQAISSALAGIKGEGD